MGPGAFARRIVAAIWIALIPAAVAGDMASEYRFVHEENRYRFEGSFRSPGDADCLLGMLYEFDRYRESVTHAESLTLDERGEDWQIVTYRYRNLFYRARSTFRRTLDRAEGRIEYRLIHLEEGGLVRPGIRNISGYYGVRDEGDARRVTFFQEGALGGGMLSGFYFNHARDVAAGFLEEIRKSAERHCPRAEKGASP